MPLPANTHAPFSRYRLDPVGYCDRCSFKYPLAALASQTEWAANSLVATGLRVCPRCLDEPQPQKRVIHLTADPKPLKNPMPGSLPPQPPQPTQFVLDDPDEGVLDAGGELT